MRRDWREKQFLVVVQPFLDQLVGPVVLVAWEAAAVLVGLAVVVVLVALAVDVELDVPQPLVLAAVVVPGECRPAVALQPVEEKEGWVVLTSACWTASFLHRVGAASSPRLEVAVSSPLVPEGEQEVVGMPLACRLWTGPS